MFNNILGKIKIASPLIHCITNYVTANDTANLLLAAGASPIMAEAPEETAEITAKSSALCINTGVLSENKLLAMLRSGKAANDKGITIVLDPVGAGISDFRLSNIKQLMRDIHFDIIRGNISEIRAISGEAVSQKGVDANENDNFNDETIELVKSAAEKFGSIIAVSGKNDIISDGRRTFIVKNGCDIMPAVTGGGCMLSALTAAFAATNTNKLIATVAAFCSMGICGETAYRNLAANEGNASFRIKMIDAMYSFNDVILEEQAKYEIR